MKKKRKKLSFSQPNKKEKRKKLSLSLSLSFLSLSLSTLSLSLSSPISLYAAILSEACPIRASISGLKCRIRPCTGQAAASPKAQMVWPSICLVTCFFFVCFLVVFGCFWSISSAFE